MIRQIVALDAKRGIAKDGKYPWHLAGELQHFKSKTMQHGGTLLMGHKTFVTIGHALAGRQNYVLSNQAIDVPDVTVIHDLAKFLDEIITDLWVIGGLEVYEQTLAASGELHVTEIEADFDCDKFYPAYRDTFELVSESAPQQENGLTYYFRIYKPKAKAS